MFSNIDRERSSEETLNWIRPLAKKIGITRIADVTWLDQFGLPVYQAIRPLSKNYIVSQGKGLSKEHAEISAIMESIEMFHAEEIIANKRATISYMKQYLCYNPHDLETKDGIKLNEDIEIEWIEAINLVSNTTTWIPKDLICLNFSVKSELLKMPFRVTSNGLATGNCKEEAVIHGLLEVIERDCLTNSIKSIVDDKNLPSSIFKWVETVKIKGHTIEIFLLKNKYNLPCFEVKIREQGKLVAFTGSACHLNKETALLKAIIEAIQSRLTFITGSRDDIQEESYQKYKKYIDERQLSKPNLNEEIIPFKEIQEVHYTSLEQQLNCLIKLINIKTNTSPLCVNLTKEEYNIPVYFIIVPKLTFKVRH